jgi:hypothetical protein
VSRKSEATWSHDAATLHGDAMRFTHMAVISRYFLAAFRETLCAAAQA